MKTYKLKLYTRISIIETDIDGDDIEETIKNLMNCIDCNESIRILGKPEIIVNTKYVVSVEIVEVTDERRTV